MNLVELKNVRKDFREGAFDKRTVLDDISLTVKQGDFIVLRGTNGAGKSTLIKVILGLIDPDRGEVSLFGQSPKSPESRLLLGTVFQEVTPPSNLKVKELISLVRSYYPYSHSTEDILESVGLIHKQYAFPTDLAGGEKQRLYFALALVGNPKLLILDEPTKNLDIEGQETFWSQLEQCHQQGVTILMVTHIKSDQDKLQKLATHIISLAEGKLTYDKQSQSVESYHVNEVASPTPEMSKPSRVFLSQFWAEILQLWRNPLYLFGVFLFSVLVAFLGLEHGDGSKQGLVFFAALCLLIFSTDRLSKCIALERVEGWLKLVRVTPLRPSIYIASKIAITLVLLTISLVTIFGIGVYKFEFHPAFFDGIKIILGLLLGAIPFVIIGIALGYSISPKSLDILTAFLIPLAVASSGEIHEAILKHVEYLIVISPFFHYTRLIIFTSAIGESDGHLMLHISWLLLYSLLAGLIAKRAYQKNAVMQ